MLSSLSNIYKNHPKTAEVISWLKTHQEVRISGLVESSFSLLLFAVFDQIKTDTVVILNDKDEAGYMFNEALSLLSEHRCDLLVAGFKKAISDYHPDAELSLLRSETIRRWIEPDRKPTILFTYPEALVETIVTPEKIKSNTINLKVNEQISTDFLTDVLLTYNFQRVDFVYEPGQFAVRGSIIDIFSFANIKPYRIDFFGETVDSIRTFDVETQISETTTNSVFIIPDINNKNTEDERVPVTELFGKNTLIVFDKKKYFSERVAYLFKQFVEACTQNKLPINKIIAVPDKLLLTLCKYKTLCKNSAETLQSDIFFSTCFQPDFSKNFELLYHIILEQIRDGYKVMIVSDQEKQLERISHILHQFDEHLKVETALINIHKGFSDNDLKICIFTDHQIFDRYQKYKIKTGFSRRESLAIEELTELHPGDYIVHIDHGIGQFGGLEKMMVNGTLKEVVKLVYRDNDTLFVNIHALHKISKYRSNEGTPPKVHKLGSNIWQNTKAKAKNKIKDIARELISLYAERLQQNGFAYSGDTFLNEQLEASFIYEDTPDQEEATKAVKADMENTAPMDRLICGDVGFGKTEIAIRAAFKAVYDKKQVAVLVPTTILAFQHFQTFSRRLKDFPVKVEYLSRMRSVIEQKNILKELKDGKVHILIGTHRIVSNDVMFNDLGLLIIDEEQKFGVIVKEKLRALKTNVDTLTLTATPIPRTLQFSLMGARDLSIIKTPPPNRQPIHTEIQTFNKELIANAIQNEISRGGQVFFIHNKVHNIIEIDTLIRDICPKARVIHAHGQMEGKQLEQIMMSFIEEKYDVLVATTIIESGVDIPNANTIIVNDAQNFGLSDLHQLRGRVGRSNKKAFCYLLTPPMAFLPAESRRRLQAIEMFTDLGSGFNIALQDLNIRGAGNLLGGEQSGFMADLGYETYQRVLQEAVYELKEHEFKNLLGDKQKESYEKDILNFKDCSIETDLNLFFPDNYVSNIGERIKLYKQIDGFTSDAEIFRFKTILADRFGKIPTETEQLIEVVKLRRVGASLGFEKITLKLSKMTCYFDSNQQSEYYNSEQFHSILASLQQQPNLARLNEHAGKLRLLFLNSVKNITKAIEILNLLMMRKTDS